MPSFNPQTAYAGDYQWFDDIEDATFTPNNTGAASNRSTAAVKVRAVSTSTSDFRAMVRNIGLREDSRGLWLWSPSATIDPRPNDRLVWGAGADDWIIQFVKFVPRGYWVLACTIGGADA